MTSSQDNSDGLDEAAAELRRLSRDTVAAIKKVQGQADAAAGAVVATVDARGRLVSLRLSDQALRLGPDRLATAIVDCIGDAQHRAEDAARTVAEPLTSNPLVAQAMRSVESLTAPHETDSRPQPSDGSRSSWLEDPIGRRGRE